MFDRPFAALFVFQQSTPSFTLDYEKMAVALGIGDMDRLAYRRQINRILKKLQNKYKLIRFSPAYNHDPTIVVVPWEEEARAVRISSRYWSLEWDRRLSFAAKCFYVVGQYEKEVSTLRPRWSVAQKTLSRRYGMSRTFMSDGIGELRRFNLLEVEYSRIPAGGQTPRGPTVYLFNPLYNFGDHEAKMLELRRDVGDAKFERALRAAVLVYEDNNLAGIKQLISLENEYGIERVNAAMDVVRVKNVDNPLRSFPYLVGTIRGGGEK